METATIPFQPSALKLAAPSLINAAADLAAPCSFGETLTRRRAFAIPFAATGVFGAPISVRPLPAHGETPSQLPLRLSAATTSDVSAGPTAPNEALAPDAAHALRAPENASGRDPAQRASSQHDLRTHAPAFGLGARQTRAMTSASRGAHAPQGAAIIRRLRADGHAQRNSILVVLQATQSGMRVFARVGRMEPTEREALRHAVAALLAEHGISHDGIAFAGDPAKSAPLFGSEHYGRD